MTKAIRVAKENLHEKKWVEEWVDACDYDRSQDALRAARGELYISQGHLDPIQLHVLLAKIEGALEDEE